ncbi:MAG: HD domain-containing protein [Clostridia bacterium]|nr:HD domain-containing protein [Clostridia bacterium]
MEIDARALKALETIENAGFEAYLVGGCVRDFLRGMTPHDYDITTSALPEQTMKAFEGYHIIETGLKHGTVTVMLDSLPLEITTFRQDGKYSDARRPDKVTFVSSLKEDLARRDFTVNAIAMDRHQNVYDFFGGQEDIKNGVIRCVGEPQKRFSEDALRLMRALRFASVTGFEIEKETENAIIALAPHIKNVAAERIATELLKTLSGKFDGLFLKHTALLSQIIPEIEDMNNCDQNNIHHIYNVWEHSVRSAQVAPRDSILRLALILHDTGKPFTVSTDKNGQNHFYGHADVSEKIARRVCRDLKLSNEDSHRIVTLVKYHDYPLENNRKILRRRLSKFGKETMLDLMAIKRADNLAQSPEFDRQKFYDETESILNEIFEDNECFSLKQLAVNGHDIIKLGFTGQKTGEILAKLLSLVVDGKLKNDKDTLLEEAKKDL